MNGFYIVNYFGKIVGVGVKMLSWITWSRGLGVQHSERERGSGYHSKDSSSWALWLQQEAEIAVSHYIVSYW